MRGRYGVLGEIARRLRISLYCYSGRDVLIRHLAVEASCAVIEVSFCLLMVSCKNSL